MQKVTVSIGKYRERLDKSKLNESSKRTYSGAVQYRRGLIAPSDSSSEQAVVEESPEDSRPRRISGDERLRCPRAGCLSSYRHRILGTEAIAIEVETGKGWKRGGGAAS